MKKYKIIIIILSILVIIEGVALFQSRQVRQKKKIIKAKPAVVAIRGEIAIVLDDWGYNLNNLAILRQIKYPLTLSILPNLPFSRKVSEEAHVLGIQVILHLAMEPHEKIRLERNTIMNSMDETTIRNILIADLNSVAYAKGVSNHMGSSATENTRTMSIIFKELKARKLFFLDSLVSSNSITTQLADKMYLRYAKRDIFLDNNEDPDYIKKQINKLKLKANAHGQAIGVGHDRKVTIQVLKEVMPELEKEGYKFVFLSELIK